ncbi:Uncharacterized protein TPAR_02734, partial [Tolypocladium paradoxum]
GVPNHLLVVRFVGTSSSPFSLTCSARRQSTPSFIRLRPTRVSRFLLPPRRENSSATCRRRATEYSYTHTYTPSPAMQSATMTFTKKIDRARQWAGEKMGGEAKTAQSDEFQMLEAAMGCRQTGMDNLQKSAAAYVKWESRRCDAVEDKSRCTPMALLGRSMTAHGNDLEPDSEFGNCLAHVGRANERISDLHTSYADQVTTTWLQHLERSVTMMKEYQAARKKLESRRLAYDASVAKMHKAKRDDFRIEEEMRVCKTKFDDSSEDVLRRMQDIKDTEVESIGALSSLLDAELAYHEKATDELRRARQALSDVSPSAAACQDDLYVPRARSNTARSRHATQHGQAADADETPRMPERMPIRHLASTQVLPPGPPPPPQSPRPSVMRAATFGARSASSSANARAPLLPRNTAGMVAHGGRGEDVLTDDESAGSDGASHGWGNRSASSTTSYDSLARVNSAQLTKKAPPPPPPPVNRAKKPPPPPVPTRRANLGY